MCRKCRNAGETGAHVALVCVENEGLERHFRSWEQIDDPKQVFRKVREEDQVGTVDLAETFFGQLGNI